MANATANKSAKNTEKKASQVPVQDATPEPAPAQAPANDPVDPDVVEVQITKRFNLNNPTEARNYAKFLVEEGADVKSEIIPTDGKIGGSRLFVNGRVVTEKHVPGFDANMVYDNFENLFKKIRDGAANGNGNGRSGVSNNLKIGRVSAADKAKAKEMASQGMSAAEIGAEIGRSPTTVRTLLSEA